MKTTRAVLGTLVGAAFVAACGSTSSPLASPASPTIAADRALARAATVRLSDFPTGWTSRPQPSGSATPSINKGLASCLHTSVAILDDKGPAEIQSPNFSDTNDDTVDSDISYDATRAKTTDDFAILEKPQLPSCLAQAISALLADDARHPSSAGGTTTPSGVSVGTPTVVPMSIPAEGDETVAYRVVVPVTDGTIEIKAYIDLIAVRQGRATTLLTFESTASPLGATMETHLAALTVGRLKDT